MNPCHNTGRVQIGIAFVPPPRQIRSADEYHIQSALLAKPRARAWGDWIIYTIAVLIVVTAVFGVVVGR